ncbi:MAG: acetyl-CoA carboxylase carboxyltransferase subunit alpha [Verrucomicrobia bacterium]|nr:acetyl-CoA carboxylase carboxyltransferase subunit alpha [Verrucomicrobiota bacterium]MCH8528591.1 acetyl-CoA carboxylase carboxyltransferase subunit alpha [Kiritimatiellia bacterium]
MSNYVLPFEKPILELEKKMSELRSFSEDQNIDMKSEVERIEQKILETKQKIYSGMSPWQKVQMARHPMRPYTRDYINLITTDFQELHGDRLYRDDRAIIGGVARFNGRAVMVIGTQKGRDTKSNLECNFGCPYPEGYRKALRLMKMADKFGMPIISFIDTPGAYPGLESEERHVAEAIAVNLREAFLFKVPFISIVIGEGGSGGALGIGVSNRILVLEHSYYSVISPEGCAAILWKDRAYADKAAENLKLTATDLIDLKIADDVVPEPLGGAHQNPEATAKSIATLVAKHLAELDAMTIEERIQDRYDKFRAIGVYDEAVNS